MEVFGIFAWPDGRCYAGQYLNDQKHGYGTFSWPNGSQFVGEWEDGMQHGQGVYFDENGVATYGVWEKGNRVKVLPKFNIEELQARHNLLEQ